MLSGGTSSPLLCPSGRYCDGSDFAQPGASCPPGTFSTAVGANSSVVCAACPAGSYCPSEGTVSPAPCPSGHATDGGGAFSSSACKACSPGTYSPSAGSASCLDCPFGTFCNSSGTVQPSQCRRGFFCPNSKTLTPVPCDLGYYCPSEGLFSPLLCPSGYYCPGIGLVSKIPCPPGHYSAQTGQTSLNTCIKCPKGHIYFFYSCIESRAITPAPLTPASGFFCEQETASATSPQPCPIGTYFDGEAAEGEKSCKVCPDPDDCKTAGKPAPDCRPNPFRPSTFLCYDSRNQALIIVSAVVSVLTSWWGGVALYKRFKLNKARLIKLGVDVQTAAFATQVLASLLVDKTIRLHKLKLPIDFKHLWEDLPVDDNQDKDVDFFIQRWITKRSEELKGRGMRLSLKNLCGDTADVSGSDSDGSEVEANRTLQGNSTLHPAASGDPSVIDQSSSIPPLSRTISVSHTTARRRHTSVASAHTSKRSPGAFPAAPAPTQPSSAHTSSPLPTRVPPIKPLSHDMVIELGNMSHGMHRHALSPSNHPDGTSAEDKSSAAAGGGSGSGSGSDCDSSRPFIAPETRRRGNTSLC